MKSHAQKRTEAAQRQEAHEKLTTEQKLTKISTRRGKSKHEYLKLKGKAEGGKLNG